MGSLSPVRAAEPSKSPDSCQTVEKPVDKKLVAVNVAVSSLQAIGKLISGSPVL